MASPNQVFSELVSTTFRNHLSKSFFDNVSRNNALLSYITKKDQVTTRGGGLSLVVPIEYAENGTYQRYSGFDVLNVAQSDVLSSAEYQWRQIAINVVASGRELRQNSDKQQIIPLVKARLKNAMNTAKNNFSFDLYSDGSATNQINGLQALISDVNTSGVVGGIDSAQFPFWRHTVQSAAAPIQGGAAITPGPTTIESLMLPAYLNTTRGNDKVDLIVASNDYFTFFEQSQTSLKRYTSGDDVSAGFTSLKYKGADVIFDGNSGIPSSRMYFINTDYVELISHETANWSQQEQMSPYNQDGVVIPILWMGNLTMSNRSLHAVVKP